jgi:23S rRNA A1618 N6-methylase RlmF
MVATELSEVGIEHARKNVAANRVGDRITIVPVHDPTDVLRGSVFPAEIATVRPSQTRSEAGEQQEDVEGKHQQESGGAQGEEGEHQQETGGAASTMGPPKESDRDQQQSESHPLPQFDFCMCNPPFFDVGEKPADRTGHRVGKKAVGQVRPLHSAHQFVFSHSTRLCVCGSCTST